MSKPAPVKGKPPPTPTPGPKPVTPSNNAKKPGSGPPRQNFAERMAEASAKSLRLAPCKFCKRKFQEGRLEDHQRICEHLQKKKRKQYDSQKQRLMGTVAESFLKSPDRVKVPKVCH